MTDTAEPPRPLAVVVLAAGSGTRMRSKTMKVLHELAGRSMVGHVLAAARETQPQWLVVVVGDGREQVAPHVAALAPEALLAVQETQAGTADAARVGLQALRDQAGTTSGTVLVMAGDTPLLQGETLAGLVAGHAAAGRAVTVLTAEVPDATGYGRVIRDSSGAVTGIVEHRDANQAQAQVREINSGVYAFDGDFLADALGRVDADNATGELYLTDVVGLAHAAGRPVGGHRVADVAQTEGANDRAQLAGLAAELNRRILDRWMRAGVTVADPATTWVDVDVVLAPDVTLLPGVQLLGTTAVGEDAVVGPDCTLRDVEVGPGAEVVRTHGEHAVVGEGASVGPFSYLRPGTVLGAGGKIGAFVETKNAEIGEGAKVPHLSYVGDAEIGEGSNITFVAPVEIGDGAATGAGTVVREDVPPGALAVSAGPQRLVEGWTLRKRPGTPMAEAAEAALEGSGADRVAPASDAEGQSS